MLLFATDTPALRQARSIAARLAANGFRAVLAGGCVRDLLLGLEPQDFDVATDAEPRQIAALFPRTLAVGANFGVMLVPGESTATPTEVATFRLDGAYRDGRRPDTVQFSRREQDDVVRRDFTINGMLLEPSKLRWDGERFRFFGDAVLDYVGGRADLRDGVVRTIGPAERRFAEDKLRMLRGVRFAARLGFSLAPDTEAAMRRLAPEITQVSSERIRDELTRMLTEGHARRAFELLDRSGLLAQVLPEVTRLHGVEQPADWHPEGDVWVHTMLLLKHLKPGCAATLAWGALLHDIGKPATYRVDPATGRQKFHGHVDVGVRMAEVILDRLRFSNDDREQIVALVKNHMRFGDVKQMKEATLRRFLRLPSFAEHLELHWLDCTACHGRLELYDFARERFAEEPAPGARPAWLVTGRDLIAAGYEPGPAFKPMLETVEDAQLEGRIHTREQGLALVAATFATTPPPADSVPEEASESTFDVLILGAGMAGLAAARELASQGLSVCVLEATERAGGRIRTLRQDGLTIELGAEFIHGQPPDLLALIAEAGLTLTERTGESWTSAHGHLVRVLDDESEPARADPPPDGAAPEDAAAAAVSEANRDLKEELKSYTGPDLPFAEYLGTLGLGREPREAATAYIEGFNAADAREASVLALGRQQRAEDEIAGDRVWTIDGGYDRLPEYVLRCAIAAGAVVRFGAVVEALAWSEDRVEAALAGGARVRGRQAVVALPLGVLRSGSVRFQPALPQVAQLVAALRMGIVLRATLVFEERLWPEAMSFLFTPQLLPSVWWATPAEARKPAMLTGWVGGPRASTLLGMAPTALERALRHSLAAALGVTERRLGGALLSLHTHDWSQDPYAQGAYSWVPVGAVEASAALAAAGPAPIHFAGEHTDTTGHWGTVHAALRSGVRAAQHVLARCGRLVDGAGSPG